MNASERMLPTVYQLEHLQPSLADEWHWHELSAASYLPSFKNVSMHQVQIAPQSLFCPTLFASKLYFKVGNSRRDIRQESWGQPRESRYLQHGIQDVHLRGLDVY